MRFLIHTAILASAMFMEMEMGMEASMEAEIVQEHTKRLAQFGMSFHPDEPAKGVEESPVVKPEEHGKILSWLRLLSFSFILKSGAIMSSIILTLSPLRTVFNMRDTKSTLAYPPYTFFCVFSCGLQWCVYGTFAFLVTGNYGFLILVYSNCLGVVFGLYYIYTYVSNCHCEIRMSQYQQCCIFAFINFSFQAAIVSTLQHTRALLIVGTIAACKSVLVTAAPLAEIKRILAERDVSSMPKDLVLASFFASVLWFGCALMLHDTWILVPNACGLVLGAGQIYLLAAFGDLITPLKKAVMPYKKGAAAIYGTMQAAGGACSVGAEEAPESPWMCKVNDGTGGTGECPPAG